MEKIVYDSLYKFLVSIGLVLIALPFVVKGILFGIDPIIISQEEFDTLSELSRDSLLSQEEIRQFFDDYFLLIILAFGLIGLVCLTVGFCRWLRIQRLIDESQAINNEIQKKELGEKTPEEKMQEVVKEVEEGEIVQDKKGKDATGDVAAASKDKEENVPIADRLRTSNNFAYQKLLSRYLIVENAVFARVYEELKDDYDVRRDAMFDSHSKRCGADILALSKKNKEDIFYEIKYYTNVKRSVSVLLKNLGSKCGTAYL